MASSRTLFLSVNCFRFTRNNRNLFKSFRAGSHNLYLEKRLDEAK
jgi:hypothetical protein